MIDMNELKPILESLGDAITSETIDKIMAIDHEMPDPAAANQAAIDELNASWEKKYREAFFGGHNAGAGAVVDMNTDTMQAPPADDVVREVEHDEPENYEDLFEKGDD